MIDTNEVSILSQLFLKYVKKLEPDEKGNFNKSSSYKKAILSDVICVSNEIKSSCVKLSSVSAE